MTDLKIGILGAGGRMGRMLAKAVHEAEGAALAGGVERKGSELLGQDFGALAGLGSLDLPITDDLLGLLTKADVLIDFTSPASTVESVKLAAQQGCGYVIGTTGLSAEDEAEIEKAAIYCPIVKAGRPRARSQLRYRGRGDAPPPQGRCALRHRLDAGGGGGQGPRA